MRKSIQLIVGLLVLSVILTAVGCARQSSEPMPVTEEESKVVVTEEESKVIVTEEESRVVVTEEESRVIAENHLKNSPTFAFDGIENTVKLIATETLARPYCWEFEYQFQCRHAGYGDRSGLILAQVITAHRARIVVQGGEVVSAVMDSKWDMMRQRVTKIGNG